MPRSSPDNESTSGGSEDMDWSRSDLECESDAIGEPNESEGCDDSGE